MTTTSHSCNAAVQEWLVVVTDLNDYRYWHTTQDTMDKVSPRSLAVAGHVILETVNELQQKFH